jgi:hypothetical protein
LGRLGGWEDGRMGGWEDGEDKLLGIEAFFYFQDFL